jgi:hypothetical protein
VKKITVLESWGPHLLIPDLFHSVRPTCLESDQGELPYLFPQTHPPQVTLQWSCHVLFQWLFIIYDKGSSLTAQHLRSCVCLEGLQILEYHTGLLNQILWERCLRFGGFCFGLGWPGVLFCFVGRGDWSQRLAHTKYTTTKLYPQTDLVF